MIRMKLAILCLMGVSAPASATPGGETTPLNARNWDVMLSQYPARAREAREQGPVGFRVTLDREGYATECEVTSSSGYPLLDNETCRMIMTRGEFRGITDEQGRRAGGVFQGVLNWKLPPPTAGAAVTAPPPAPAKAGPAQAGGGGKLICRRKLRTGSLAQFERTCLTKEDWERYTANERAFWEEVQSKGHTHGN
jgi:TonB family protein